MMNNRHLITLAVVTLLLVITAAVFVNQEQQKTQQTAGEKLFPELQKEINNVARIKVSDAKNHVTIILKEGQWLVSEKNNYYADASKIRGLLLQLAELELHEAKTKIADNYSKLGVDDPQTSATSKQLLISDEAGKTIAAVILGTNHSPGLYVRKVDDPQSWLVKGFITANSDARWWLDKVPVKMNAQQVARITVVPAEGDTFTLSRKSGKDKLILSQLPEGHELKNIDALQSALQSISFDEVVRADTVDLANASRSRIEYSSFDGRTITIESFRVADKNYVRFSISGDNQAGTAAANQRLSGWLYRLPDYQHDNINKRLADIIQRKAS
jgi:hypothetical protein